MGDKMITLDLTKEQTRSLVIGWGAPNLTLTFLVIKLSKGPVCYPHKKWMYVISGMIHSGDKKVVEHGVQIQGEVDHKLETGDWEHESSRW